MPKKFDAVAFVNARSATTNPVTGSVNTAVTKIGDALSGFGDTDESETLGRMPSKVRDKAADAVLPLPAAS